MILAMPSIISLSLAESFPAGSRMVSPTLIASPSLRELHFMISSTLIDRFRAIDSSVSPLRNVYGRMAACPAARGAKGTRAERARDAAREETLPGTTARRAPSAAGAVRAVHSIVVSSESLPDATRGPSEVPPGAERNAHRVDAHVDENVREGCRPGRGRTTGSEGA